MEKTAEFKGLRFDGIQLLRAISALMVATYHIDFIYNLGLYTAVGVDIFFVISGFIIMYTTQGGIKDYGKKRIIKIVPLYWLLTIITFFAAFIVKGVVPYEPTIVELIMSLLFIPYSRDGIRSTDVTRPIVGPAHTLLNEMFFYLIFYISAKINHKRRGKIAAIILVALVISGLIFDFSGIPVLKVWTNKRMIDFALGILLFYILKYIYKKNKFYLEKNGREKSIIITVLSLILICVMVLFPSIPVLGKGIISMIVVLCFSIAFFNLKIPKPLEIMGNISYSFYLIHYYVILIFKKFITPMETAGIKEIICAVLAIVITLILSYISYQLIEVKFANFLKSKFIKKDKKDVLVKKQIS